MRSADSAHVFRIAVHLVIFPAVAEVAFVVVKTDQPPLVKQAKPTRRQVVVLVDFGQPLGEVKLLVVDRMVERHLHPFHVGKDLGHRGAHVHVHAVIVADVKEPSRLQIRAQLLRFTVGKQHVAVTGHVHPRVVEQVRRPHFHVGHFVAQDMPISVLQKSTRLGTAVGLAYQSPPPRYCNTANWTSAEVWATANCMADVPCQGPSTAAKNPRLHVTFCMPRRYAFRALRLDFLIIFAHLKMNP